MTAAAPSPPRAPGRVLSGEDLTSTESVEVDFCVVGSGAAGSIAAAKLAQGGAQVAVLEEGGHYTKRDFNLQEAWAFPALYQEHGNRATDDLAIAILQGRSVGGGTTVNWTSSFRPPEATLKLWADRHGVRGLDAQTLAPHLAAVEARLSVGTGDQNDVNANNRKIWDGATRLGWKPELIRRNVKGCARLGFCGLGCPLDAKQSALVTYVQDAVAAGADVYADCRARFIETDRARARAVVADVLDRAADRPRGRLVIHARHGIVLAAGAINTPALLLRSRVGTDSGQVGRRTFLHPTIPLAAFYDQTIEGFYGPPQSVSVHHFAHRPEGVGYFIEASPTHPMLSALAFPGFGDAHRRLMERLPFLQATIALLIDGHHDDEGGTVSADGAGRIKLNYPLASGLREAAVHAIGSMARLQLAAGAKEIVTLHESPLVIRSEADVARVAEAPFGPNRHAVFSAHQMGGCAMGEDPRTSVVDSQGRHHELGNVWIVDGSVFPTSLGVNPQLTIYALASRFSDEILNDFKHRPAR